MKVHQDAQRLLEPLQVVNPFAEQLTFADARTRTRPDTELVDALARAQELHENLAAITARLERRLDRQSPEPVDPGR